MALPTKLGPVRVSLAVDTGAAVNVLSERTYKALKRASRGGRYRLRPSDLNLRGVSSDPLDILGVVRLPVKLGKGTSVMTLNFYVAANFSLPSDGLLGLSPLNTHQMVIISDRNLVQYQGKDFSVMNSATSLVSLPQGERMSPALRLNHQ